MAFLFKGREKTPVFDSHYLYSFNVATGGGKNHKKDSIRTNFLHSHVCLYCHSQRELSQRHTFIFFVLLHIVLQIMTFNVNMNSSILDNGLFLVPPYYCSVQRALRKNLHLSPVNIHETNKNQFRFISTIKH